MGKSPPRRSYKEPARFGGLVRFVVCFDEPKLIALEGKSRVTLRNLTFETILKY